MRGVETRIRDIRHRIFTEVARMAYHTEWPTDRRIEALPYDIMPGEVAENRQDIFLERAIVGERLRLAMGLPCRSAAEHAPLSDNIDAATKEETYYTPPLINIIKFACNACPENQVRVTDVCQGCMARPCVEVCPKGAVSIDPFTRKSILDQDKCIKCGRCDDVCAYKAINHQKRPCAAACGMDAIHSDPNGRADIDYDKCVSCGQCLVNCPFGAIADKSQIFQMIRAIQAGERVYAAVAPAFVGQFGPKVTPGKLRAAMKQLGFADIIETPMTLTARLIKHHQPGAKVAFIGPCAAKKLEAMRRTVRSEVDFVLTFEEMAGIFEARHIDVNTLKEDPHGVNDASADGRNFAVSGGVAQAVVNVIKEKYPDREIKVANAEGLSECRKLMMMAKAGKYNGYLLEGMACPGGCVAGAGTMQSIKKSSVAVNMYAKQAEHQVATGTHHVAELDKLVD